MTWGELKAAIEAAGVTDETTIGYIEVDAPPDGYRLGVRLADRGNGGVNITAEYKPIDD